MSSSGVTNRAIATITRDGHCAQLLEGFSAADGEEMFSALLSALSRWYEHQLRIRLGETADETIDQHPELLFETEQQLLQVPHSCQSSHQTAIRPARTTSPHSASCRNTAHIQATLPPPQRSSP